MMRAFVVCIIVLALLTSARIGIEYGRAHAHTRVNPTVCTEDMPCWDCHTMGNHICGTP